jgi:transposase
MRAALNAVMYVLSTGCQCAQPEREAAAIMHMIGYFEGIDSERGIAWRCADSFSLRDFLRLSNRDKVPDHSWLSRTWSRLSHEAHEKVFGWVLKLVAERGLLNGERIGVDGSTMEANAALRTTLGTGCYGGWQPRMWICCRSAKT